MDEKINREKQYRTYQIHVKKGHKFLINADINGAGNILRKVVPKTFVNGIAAVCSQPEVVNVQ